MSASGKVDVEMDGGISEGSGRTEAVAAPAQGAEKELKLSSQCLNGQRSLGDLSVLNPLAQGQVGTQLSRPGGPERS